ncbi:hypothetical protein [Pseudomonas sp. UMAB-40]|uniref:hypothetical protein n=1 Tax=Pseudomonas sp. UMAB-40 TaxID=1365407 RepID=UPI001C56CD66|nr:hypothetical protein [Pseudomonas sp. UMAB-40]
MTELNRYTVLPFSGARFHENESRLGDGELPCAICGKVVAQPFAHTATVVGGGAWAETAEDAANTTDAGYMGVWGIGPNCHAKYLVKAANGRTSPLKVFLGLTYTQGKQLRTIVAARTQKTAAQLLGIPLNHLQRYWSVSGNKVDLDTALASPEVVFLASDSVRRDYSPAPTSTSNAKAAGQ